MDAVSTALELRRELGERSAQDFAKALFCELVPAEQDRIRRGRVWSEIADEAGKGRLGDQILELGHVLKKRGVI